MSPNGWLLQSNSHVTNDSNSTDTNYQSDVLLATILDPSSADTYPGDGDFILEFLLTAGEVKLSVDFGYHTHSETHP